MAAQLSEAGSSLNGTETVTLNYIDAHNRLNKQSSHF